MAWVVFIVLVIMKGAAANSRTVGLSLAYTVNMAIMHCGALLYLKGDYNHRHDAYLRSFNFTENTVATGFHSDNHRNGLLFAWRFYVRNLNRRIVQRKKGHWPVRRVILCLSLIAFGSFIATKILPAIPFVQAVFGAGRNAALSACALGFVISLQNRKIRDMGIFAALAIMVPAFYLLAFGFVSYGIIFAVTLISFCIFQFKLTVPRLIVGILPALLITYLGISVFVGYMQNRTELRKVLWSDKGISERVDAIGDSLEKGVVVRSGGPKTAFSDRY